MSVVSSAVVTFAVCTCLALHPSHQQCATLASAAASAAQLWVAANVISQRPTCCSCAAVRAAVGCQWRAIAHDGLSHTCYGMRYV